MVKTETGRRDNNLRGPKKQRETRSQERHVRKQVLSVCRWAERCGHGPRETASRIGVKQGLLYDWNRQWRDNRLPALTRGRPPLMSTPHQRRQVWEVLQLLGPLVGVPTLQSLFPHMARRELAYLAERFRRIIYNGNHMDVFELTWHWPGSVWSMDYTEPPLPVDGIYRQILVVRDLGTGKQLEAMPVPEKGAIEVLSVLKSLFLSCGPPLVIKSDNDSTFKDKRVRNLLKEFKVQLLLSPPYMPEYNGACEAGVGSLKTRAHHISARNGRPGQWCCDDVEGARLQANELARPSGHDGPSPRELWEERIPPSERDRRLFRKRVAENLRSFRNKEEKLDKPTVKRRSVSRALEMLGYFTVRRRRITALNKSA